MMTTLTRLPVARPTTEFLVETLPDEVLVYDQVNHRAHCLTPAAALVWSLCDGGSVDRARASLSAAGHTEQVESVVHQLEAAGLLRARAKINQSRRRMLSTTAVAAGVILASPVIYSIVSPSVAQAVSGPCGLGGQQCCQPGNTCKAKVFKCSSGGICQ